MSKRFPLSALVLGLLCILVFQSRAFAQQKSFPTRQINYMTARGLFLLFKN